MSTKNLIKPRFRKSDVYWRYPVLYKKNREKIINKAKNKKIIITSHYPALNKFQHNSKLKNAKVFDSSVINFFVKDKNSSKYLDNICKLLNN